MSRAARFVLVFVLALALPCWAQRGPVDAPSTTGTVHAAPLTYDSHGQPDSWFQVKVRRHAELLPDERLTAVLVLQDGTEWRADLGRAPPRVLEASAHERTTLRWAMFAREGGVQRRIGGVHLFSTTRADGLVEHVAVFSNGAVTPSVAGSFCGPFYYSRLTLDLQERPRRAWADLRAGEALEDGRRLVIIAGGEHWMPPRAQFTRRLWSYPRPGLLESGEGQLERVRAAAELRDLALPPRLSAWGALKVTRTAESSSTALEGALARLRASLRSGRTSDPDGRFLPAMGPLAPLGYSDAGAVSGTGILPVPAPEFSLAAARWHRLVGDLVSERMPIVQVDRDTGEPLTPADWACGGASQGFEYRLTRGWGGITQIPAFAAQEDWTSGQLAYAFLHFNNGTCPYREALVALLPHDDAHLSRATKDDQASWQLSHDWAAWLRMRFIAADVELSHTLRGARPLVAEYPGQWLPYSLEAALARAKAAPGHGGQILRQLGWAMDAVAGSAVTLPPGPERAGHVTWARAMLELSRATVLPSGIAYDGRVEWGSDNGIPWNDKGLERTAGEAPQFQVPIYNNGLATLIELVGRADPLSLDVVGRVLARSAESQYLGGLAFVPSEYGGPAVGPPWYLVVSENGAPLERVLRGVGLSHWIHSYHDLALAWRYTRDARFLRAMPRVGVPVTTLEARLAGFEAQRKDREWIVLPEAALREHLR